MVQNKNESSSDIDSLRHRITELEQELTNKNAEITNLKNNYNELFNNIGVAISEFDITGLREFIQDLKDQNITLQEYFQHPENLMKYLSFVKPKRFNKKAIRLFEAQDEAELITKQRQILTSKTLEGAKAAHIALYNDEPFYEGENEYQTLTGKLVKVIDRITHPVSNPNIVIASLIDITKRIHVETELRRSEERYRSLFDHVPIMIWEEDLSEVKDYLNSLNVENGEELRELLLDTSSGVLDEVYKKFKVLDVNKTCVDILKAPNKEDLMNNVSKYFTKDSVSIFIDNIVHIHENKLFIQHETHFQTSLGEILDFLVTWQVVPGFEENFARVLVLMNDITDKKEMEQEKLKIHAQLQHFQKLDSLGLLAGGIAHDFNNLLVPILGNINLAQTYVDESSPIFNHLNQVEEHIKRASELTKQLLTYSGKGKFIVESCNLNSIIKNLNQLIRLTATKSVNIDYDLHKELPNIEGDETQLQQVIINLIANAASAMNNSGTITIHTSFRDFNELELRRDFAKYQLNPGTYVQLKISDEGVGIPNEIKDNIFDPFYTTKKDGRGLGLSVVHGIVVTHNGGIRFETQKNSGTDFYVIFPKTTGKNRKKNRPSVQKRMQSKRNSGTILICDDEPDVREITSNMLQRMGYEVIEAENGKECLKIFKQNEIDLIILDLTMPEMDGEQTAKELRKMSKKLPIILMSGYNEYDIELRFTGVKLSAFLQKPFTYERLTSKVSEFVN